jgi:hypothetical protein
MIESDVSKLGRTHGGQVVSVKDQARVLQLEEWRKALWLECKR